MTTEILEELRAIQRILNGHSHAHLDLHEELLKLRRGQLEAAERIERIERRLGIEGSPKAGT